jgi:hypothetical protein
MKTTADILIIGAGLSGLVAANTLQNKGFTVTVLEKEPLPGGQMATARIGDGLADYGAQFFTCRTKIFQQQVDLWLESGLVYVWSDEWSDGSIKRTTANGQPRYAVNGGMIQLMKQLTDKLDDVRAGITVRAVQWQDDNWLVIDKSNRVFSSRMLILTPPVPQSLALVKDVPLNEVDRSELDRIYYSPCLCGLFTIEGESQLPPSGAVQNFDRDVYWIADNQIKGISPEERVITVHVNKRYSEQHFNDSEGEILAFLRAELQPYLKSDAIIKRQELKKWRYSTPMTTYPLDILKATGIPLIFAGAAFGGRGRIEGAYLSGLAAGRATIDLLVAELAMSSHSK